MTSVDTNNGEVFFPSFFTKKNFLRVQFFRSDSRLHDELKRMSPSPPLAKKIVLDPVGMFQGSHNAEK